MQSENSKLIFLVVTSDPAKQKFFETAIAKHVKGCTLYVASDYATGRAKFDNDPPTVVITDFEFPRVKGPRLIDELLAMGKKKGPPIIISAQLPKKEKYLDEMVSGRVQFFEGWKDDAEFSRCLFSALNFSTHRKEAEFYVRFLAAGQLLLQEGAKGDFVYILKEGLLRAYKTVGTRKVVLGEINRGEFVGEMAYVNGGPRTASVEAVDDSELVEIPVGVLGRVLCRRPAWSHKLLVTLSKRLKAANEARVRDQSG